MRNIWLLGLVSMFTDISSEMIFAVFPIFLKEVLKASFLFVGVVEGLAEASANILKGVFGALSDMLGRRKALALSGYALSNLVKPLLFFVKAPVWAGVIRVVDRVGKGVRTAPRDAMIADFIPAEMRGRAFGLHRALDTAGAFIGVGIAYLLLLKISTTEAAIRTIFALSAIPGAIAVTILATVREPKTQPAKPSLAKGYFGFLLPVFMFGMSHIGFAFLILRARELGFSVPNAVLMYLLYNLIYFVSAYPVGALSDKIGKRRTFVLSVLMNAVVLSIFAFKLPVPGVVLAFVAYGVFSAAFETSSRAFVSGISEKLKGSHLGAFNTTIGLGQLAGNSLIGAIWNAASAEAAFLVAGALSLLAFFLLAYGKSLTPQE